MRIFKACIFLRRDGSVFKTVTAFGSLETIDDFVDLLRKVYSLPLNNIRMVVDLIGSLKDVD